ncbi:MAG: TRAP transporter small permease [Sedimentisphaerales bacterium]|nr:TRAP transporter small permease [Sedimentisphaerales bacterium]
MIIEIIKKSRILLCRILEIALMIAVLVLVSVVIWGVLTRACGTFVAWLATKGIEAWPFLPRGQNKYSEEFARFLLIWVSLLGGAVAFGEKAHLGVDYFVEKFDWDARKFMTIFGQFVVLFFAISIFIIGGSNVVIGNLAQKAPALGKFGLKMGHVYMALPIAGVFMIIFAVEQLLEAIFSDKQTEGEN